MTNVVKFWCSLVVFKSLSSAHESLFIELKELLESKLAFNIIPKFVYNTYTYIFTCVFIYLYNPKARLIIVTYFHFGPCRVTYIRLLAFLWHWWIHKKISNKQQKHVAELFSLDMPKTYRNCRQSSRNSRLPCRSVHYTLWKVRY